jgi:hypothetical protein
MNLLNQIRSLQLKGESFAIELSSGRIIQVYDSFTVATYQGSGPAGANDLIGVLHASGFDLIPADQIAAITTGIHPQETERVKKRIDEFKTRHSEGEK